MRAELLPFYERTLISIRQHAADFARRHRGAAEKLLLSPDSAGECRDPHVERLIEAFAYMAAGIHLRLDDDFTELATALLQVVAPHLIAPLPSVAIVHLDPSPKLDRPVLVPAGTELLTRPVGGLVCRFLTAYPLRIWPIDVGAPLLDLPGRAGLREDGAAVLRVKLTSSGGPLGPQLEAAASAPKEDPAEGTALRFYLDGDEGFGLYDLLFGSTIKVLVRGGESGPAHTAELRQVGMEHGDLLWPSGPRSQDSYALLQEYFAFPRKFLFFDLIVPAPVRASLGQQAEVLFLLARDPGPDRKFSSVRLRLSCTPVVNLFKHTADSITVTHQESDYLVEPSASRRDAYEVYSVDRVSASDGRGEFLPLYSQRHLSQVAFGGGLGAAVLGDQPGPLGYYLAERRAPTLPGRTRTEVYLSFVDLSLRTRTPTAQRLNVVTRCTSGDLPKHVGANPGFTLTTGAASNVARVSALVPPCPTRRPPLGRGLAWRLISHLSLNYLSVGDHASGGRQEDAVAALRELLLLHAAHASPDGQDPLVQQILGLSKIEAEPTLACQRGMSGPCRGLKVTLTLDPPSYQGTSQILFASVIERFLGRYVSINSFTQMVARDRHDRVLKKWMPRAGDRVLL
jgi:type VI secretion system protein ImpG